MSQALPARFRLIHLDLAREAGHPEGSSRDGYVLVLPLDENGRIDERLVQTHSDACCVGRILEGEPGPRGTVRHGAGGRWTFDFGDEVELPFKLSEQCFRPGEYLSLRREDQEHTYRVVALQPIPTGATILAEPLG
jgi:hypothetical protein